jgi:hypothetical protein
MMVFATIGGIMFLPLILFGSVLLVGSYISESPEQFQYKIDHGFPIFFGYLVKYVGFVLSGAINGFFLAVSYNLYHKFTRHAPLKVKLIEENSTATR